MSKTQRVRVTDEEMADYLRAAVGDSATRIKGLTPAQRRALDQDPQQRADWVRLARDVQEFGTDGLSEGAVLELARAVVALAEQVSTQESAPAGDRTSGE